MKNNRGFTLIELVITIGLMVVALFSYFVVLQTVASTRFLKHQTLSYQVALKKVEELKSLPFSSLPSTGPFTDSALSVLSQPQANLTISNYGGSAQLKEITVTISWQEMNKTKTVELKTLLTEGGV